jgi:ribonuclease P protein component
MRRARDFHEVISCGQKVRRGALVVHFRAGPPEPGSSGSAGPIADPTIGLVVGRSVGNSVIRHRVSRRLRAQLASRLPLLPKDCAVVVRALPTAGAADSATLGRDLDAALVRLRSCGLGR